MQLFFLVVLLLLGGSVGRPLGGLFYLLGSISFAALVSLPRIGAFFHFVLWRVLPFRGALKLGAWVISGSGLLLGYLGWGWWVRQPLSSLEASVIAILAGCFALRSAQKIVMLEMFEPVTFADAVERFEGLPFFEQLLRMQPDPEANREIERRSFADLNFTHLLHLLFSGGLLIFSLGQLGLIRSPLGEVPSLLTSVLAAFSAGDLGFTEPPNLVGISWVVVRLALGLVLLVWLVAFIALALEGLGEARKRQQQDDPEPLEVKVRRAVEVALAEMRDSGPEPLAKRPRGSRSSAKSKSVVNPEGPRGVSEGKKKVARPRPRLPKPPAAGQT